MSHDERQDCSAPLESFPSLNMGIYRARHEVMR